MMQGKARLRRNLSLQSGIIIPLGGKGVLGGVEIMRIQIASDANKGNLSKRPSFPFIDVVGKEIE